MVAWTLLFRMDAVGLWCPANMAGENSFDTFSNFPVGKIGELLELVLLLLHYQLSIW